MSALPSQLRVYSPSGAFSIAGTLVSLVAGSAAGVILGAVYAYANHHSPIIYLNVFLTMGFGFALGWLNAKSIHMFHIRNGIVAAAIGLIVFAVAYVAHWCVYIPAVLVSFNENVSSLNIPLILETAVDFAKNPGMTWEWIKAINENGVWSITSPGSRGSGIPVSGIFLTLIWIAEAGIIGFMSVSMSCEKAGKPYSERQGKWLTAKALPANIAFVDNRDGFLNALARGDYSALTTPLKTPSEEITNYASVVLYSDAFEPYVSVSNVTLHGASNASSAETQAPKPPNRGKKWLGRLTGCFKGSSSKKEGESSVDVIVEYLKITPTAAQNITNALDV